jgi:hypothetical protein
MRFAKYWKRGWRHDAADTSLSPKEAKERLGIGANKKTIWFLYGIVKLVIEDEIISPPDSSRARHTLQCVLFFHKFSAAGSDKHGRSAIFLRNRRLFGLVNDP